MDTPITNFLGKTDGNYEWEVLPPSGAAYVAARKVLDATTPRCYLRCRDRDFLERLRAEHEAKPGGRTYHLARFVDELLTDGETKIPLGYKAVGREGYRREVPDREFTLTLDSSIQEVSFRDGMYLVNPDSWGLLVVEVPQDEGASAVLAQRSQDPEYVEAQIKALEKQKAALLALKETQDSFPRPGRGRPKKNKD